MPSDRSRRWIIGIICLFLAADVVVGAVFLLKDTPVYVFRTNSENDSPSLVSLKRTDPAPTLRDYVSSEIPYPPLPIDLSTPTADDPQLTQPPFDVQEALRKLREAKPSP